MLQQSYFDFFAELAQNNEREWFLSQKKRYESVAKEPFLELVDKIVAALADIANTGISTLIRVEEASGLRQACVLLIRLHAPNARTSPEAAKIWIARARQLVETPQF